MPSRPRGETVLEGEVIEIGFHAEMGNHTVACAGVRPGFRFLSTAGKANESRTARRGDGGFLWCRFGPQTGLNQLPPVAPRGLVAVDLSLNAVCRRPFAVRLV